MNTNALASAGNTTPGHGTAAATDRFVTRDGIVFAGTHLIVDLWEASRLDEQRVVERAPRMAAEAAGATVLRLDLHAFPDTGGVTGVAVLAESHILIHTWPERAYAATSTGERSNRTPRTEAAAGPKDFIARG